MIKNQKKIRNYKNNNFIEKQRKSRINQIKELNKASNKTTKRSKKPMILR